MKIVEPEAFPFVWFNLIGYQKRPAGNQKTRRGPEYKDVITAFDIEASRLPEIEQSIMYVWLWCFGNEYIVVGRTWDSFLWFSQMLAQHMNVKQRLVCYVHNLSYEFAFLRGIYRFMPDDVFAVKPRKILKATMGNIEFRCSYLHSNMSLDEYLDKMGVEHKKIAGFDYSKIRYPWTELTDSELTYCVHDVVGLVEALTVEMRHDGDSLYTIPLTSTGYVRRDAKRAMRDVSYNYLHNQLPDYPIFEMLHEAFRGGDTHANRFFSGQIVTDGESADRSSSYPDIVCNCQFPVSEFFRTGKRMRESEVLDLIITKGKAVIMRCAITGLHLRDNMFPCPYLSTDKCRNIIKACYDNGRILMADYLETTITDIDLRILLREYEWADIVFYDVAYARYGPLPQPLIAETIKYYKAKTELKNVDGQEVYYTKSKNKLNSIYGMMAQNPCKKSLIYTQDGVIDKYGRVDYYPEDNSKTDKQILEDSNRRAFLAYQWGCWVTAWARYRLHEGIWLVMEQGAEFLYCDTDSIKYLGAVDWSIYNRERVKDSKRSGAFATDPAGEVHYMGVFEQEAHMMKFRTWGAKKYCYTVMKKGRETLVCTVAGVGKSKGAKELEAHGGITAFKPGFVFVEAGGLEAVYNDAVDMFVEAEGRRLHITPNVTLRPSTYKLGLSGDYERLLRNYKTGIDI